MSNNDLIAKVTELREMKQLAEEVAAEITALEDSLKKELDNRNVEELAAGLFKIRYKTIASSKFDSRSFKATHTDLYNQYCKPTVGKRFSIA